MQAPLESESMHSVKGLIAVVTGAGSGIGQIMATALEHNGAKVYILGRTLEKLKETVARAKFGNIIPIQASVTSHDDLQRAVDRIRDEEGYINLLINNAGISTPNLGPPNTRPGPKWSLGRVRDYWFSRSYEDYLAVMQTNTVANLIVSFAFLELLDQGNKMREAEAALRPNLNPATAKMRSWVSSQIITTSSIGGFGRDHAAFIYNASKAATTHMMKHLATYLVPFGIRSNIIAPGFWHTGMTDDVARGIALTGGAVPKTLIPEQRFGTEQEMGGTIVYLASPAAGYCNGSVFVIDGGYLTNHPSTY
ncbi:hypothetical protein TruAng_006239 [Truncatella angustata]|nr:hypothetical protein TruAng_006239 [Truncatella angustata]